MSSKGSDEDIDFNQKRYSQTKYALEKPYSKSDYKKSIRIRTSLMFIFIVYLLIIFLVTSRPFLYDIGLEGSLAESLSQGSSGALFRLSGVIGAIASITFYLIINYLQFGFFIATKRNIEALMRSSASSIEMLASDFQQNSERPLVDQAREAPGGVERQVSVTRERLSLEMRELGRRGNINLFIGIMTTILGLIILGYVVFFESDLNNSNPMRYSSHFVMRISIALFVEIFAYFFLRLYKNGIDDIKYYQNEITNIEMKFASLTTAKELGNATLIKISIESLAKTERNFILKKTETTLSLEREKLDKNEVLDLVKSLAVRMRVGR